MTLIELHPEELFDKLVAGTVSGPEAERLRAHLAECAVCRFELAVRGDFEADLQRALARTAAAPAPRVLVPEPPPVLGAAERLRLRPRRRPAWVWGLAAAALLIATGALASAYTGVPPWQLFEDRQAKAPAEPRASTKGAKRPRSAKAAEPAVATARVSENVVPSAAVVVDAPAVAAAQAAAPLLPAQGSAPRRALEPAVAPSAAALFAEANRARAGGESAVAIRLYRQLQQRFPRSSEAALSELTLATLLLHTGEARAALTSFDSYLGRGSRPLDAEALVGRALSLRALGQRDQEAAAWRSVIDRYPGSSYARRAAERLAALRKP